MTERAALAGAGQRQAGEEAAAAERKGESGGPRGWRLARLALLVAWPPLFALAVMAGYGRDGFNPTDPGFILAGSWRIAHGQVPHLDLISARPLGSAVFHLIDLALPGPLLLASGAFMVLEMAVAAIALTAFVTRRSPLSWGLGLVGATIAATLVNLHTFPATAWHTVDGVLFTALGWHTLDVGLRAGGRRRRLAGLALVGCATLVKQSFAPAALVALVISWSWSPGGYGRPRRPSPRRAAADLAALLATPIAYTLWVAAAGGLGEMLRQVLGGQGVWGRRLLVDVWTRLGGQPGAAWPLAAYAALLAALAALAWHGRRAGGLGRAPSGGLARLALGLRLVAALAVLAQVALGRLTLNGEWGSVLAWMLAGAIALAAVERRRPHRRALAVLALGWMVSLSWGYDTPDLVGGSLALTTLVVLLPAGIRWPAPGARPLARALAGLAAGALAVAAASALFASARAAHTYRELPPARLSKDAGAIEPSMRGIRVGARTYAYLSQVRSCLASHPARQVAVLPDNAGLYPVFGLSDPFPIDWMTRMELVGDARARVLSAAAALDRRGHYLVLFETVDARQLAITNVPAHVGPDTPPVDDAAPLQRQIQATLHGQRIVCGSFVGVWSR